MTAVPAPNAEKSRRIVLLVSCYIMATGSAMFVGPATCLSVIAVDLNMVTAAQKGVFLSAGTWGMAVMSALSGWLVGRLGFRWSLVGSGLLQGGGLLAISSAQVAWAAIGGALILGLGRGIQTAPLTALLCELYPGGRTRVVSLFHSFWYIGMAVLLLFVLAALRLDWEWRTIFRVFAAMALLVAATGLLRVFPGRAPPITRQGERMSVLAVARHPGVWLLVPALMLSGITELGPSSWLPYFVEQGIGSTRASGSLGLLAYAAIMVVGRLSTPFVVRRWGIRRFAAVAGTLCMVSLPMAAMNDDPTLSVAWMMLLGLGITGVYPAVNAYAADRFPQAGNGMFVVLNSSALAGVVVAPMALGFVADALSLRWAMGLMAVPALLWMVALLQSVRIMDG